MRRPGGIRVMKSPMLITRMSTRRQPSARRAEPPQFVAPPDGVPEQERRALLRVIEKNRNILLDLA